MALRNKVSGVIGGMALLVNIGLTDIVNAQKVAMTPKKPNNLAEYGIPSVEGLTPYQTNWLDKTDKIPGKETKLELYQGSSGEMIAVYSFKNKPYNVVVDKDWKPPVDLSVLDYHGNGTFEKIPGNKTFYAPDWVSRE